MAKGLVSKVQVLDADNQLALDIAIRIVKEYLDNRKLQHIVSKPKPPQPGEYWTATEFEDMLAYLRQATGDVIRYQVDLLRALAEFASRSSSTVRGAHQVDIFLCGLFRQAKASDPEAWPTLVTRSHADILKALDRGTSHAHPLCTRQ